MAIPKEFWAGIWGLLSEDSFPGNAGVGMARFPGNVGAGNGSISRECRELGMVEIPRNAGRWEWLGFLGTPGGNGSVSLEHRHFLGMPGGNGSVSQEYLCFSQEYLSFPGTSPLPGMAERE